MNRSDGEHREELTDFVDVAPAAQRSQPDPAQYVLNWPWYYPSLFGGTAAVLGLLSACGNSVAGILTLAVVGTLTGVVLTMIAMAWGVAIVFADDSRRGLWFVIFPPYMVIYAVRRWKWMAQPSVMFLCGLALALASLWLTERFTQSLAPRQSKVVITQRMGNGE